MGTVTKVNILKTKMDINEILKNVGEYLQKNENIKVFKIGFVGNGEPMLAKKNSKNISKLHTKTLR